MATLPNASSAVVDIHKLTHYCLSQQHPRGRHKARVFEAALGLTTENADELQAALANAAIQEEVIATNRDEFGERFVVEFQVEGPHGSRTVRSIWIVRSTEDFPRFVTCHVV